MIDVRPLALDGVLEICVRRFRDDRGFFAETYNARAFEHAGIDVQFVQDNHSFSPERGVLRGLHYQLPPMAQDKLVRVGSGAIFDVAVDLRPGSRTFGQWAGVELSAARGNQMFVPAGFAHGFVTLEENTEVIYKVSAFYAPEFERAVRFDDPDIAIQWPIPLGEAKLSQKDRLAPRLADAEVFCV